MSFPGLVNLHSRAHANLLLSQPSQRREMIARRTNNTRTHRLASAYFGNGQIRAIVHPSDRVEPQGLSVIVCTGYLYVEGTVQYGNATFGE